jgi:very-short-patch-repair endonuclease
VRDARSKGEAALDIALAEVFGPTAVTREMPIKIFGRTLFVDRVLQGYKIAFEVDGIQHDAFNEFFHGNADGFKSHKERDKYKAAWLDANGFTLIRFKSKDKISPELVRQRVQTAISQE